MNLSVSILIPFFNSEKTISKCIESVLNQTYANTQIIIINDGSNDDSANIVSGYIKNKNIIYIEQKNLGLSKTRNNLIKQVKTDYFFFVDSDDFIDPELIYNFMEEAKKTPKINLILNTSFLSVGKKDKKWYLTSFYKNDFKKEDYLANNAIYAWNILYKTGFFKKNNFSFNEIYPFFEDCGSLIFWLASTDMVKVINSPGYHYVRWTESLSNKKHMPYSKINGAIQQYCGLEKDINILFSDKQYPQYINNQLAFYRSILHTYIFFQSKCNKLEKKDLKKQFKEINLNKLKFPKKPWMFFYYLVTKIIK